jgi:hypothetical protein
MYLVIRLVISCELMVGNFSWFPFLDFFEEVTKIGESSFLCFCGLGHVQCDKLARRLYCSHLVLFAMVDLLFSSQDGRRLWVELPLQQVFDASSNLDELTARKLSSYLITFATESSVCRFVINLKSYNYDTLFTCFFVLGDWLVAYCMWTYFVQGQQYYVTWSYCLVSSLLNMLAVESIVVGCRKYSIVCYMNVLFG